jgi:glycosyltransferase involved in cell wall biosynthesis
VLAEIGAPSAVARHELGAAPGALGRSRPGLDPIVDEDLPGWRALLRREAIAFNQFRKAIGAQEPLPSVAINLRACRKSKSVRPPLSSQSAFVGRISPEKGPVDAIRIAKSLGIPLKIAAKVDKLDESCFREVVQPMLSTEGVDFIGEINERAKGPFLRDAIALLFPICWPEPFGLVMIEAMACGTPVLAYRAGAVPEVGR